LNIVYYDLFYNGVFQTFFHRGPLKDFQIPRTPCVWQRTQVRKRGYRQSLVRDQITDRIVG